jgi:hypothetical protein
MNSFTEVTHHKTFQMHQEINPRSQESCLIYLFKLDKIYVESKNENQPMRNEIKGD